jgi:hypothetical protein
MVTKPGDETDKIDSHSHQNVLQPCFEQAPVAGAPSRPEAHRLSNGALNASAGSIVSFESIRRLELASGLQGQSLRLELKRDRTGTGRAVSTLRAQRTSGTSGTAETHANESITIAVMVAHEMHNEMYMGLKWLDSGIQTSCGFLNMGFGIPLAYTNGNVRNPALKPKL